MKQEEYIYKRIRQCYNTAENVPKYKKNREKV